MLWTLWNERTCHDLKREKKPEKVTVVHLDLLFLLPGPWSYHLLFMAWFGDCRKSMTVSSPISSVWWFKLHSYLFVTRVKCPIPLSLNIGCVWNVCGGGGAFSVWFWPAQPGHVFLALSDWMAFVRATAHNMRGVHPAFLKDLWNFGVYSWIIAMEVQKYIVIIITCWRLNLTFVEYKKQCWKEDNLLNCW